MANANNTHPGRGPVQLFSAASSTRPDCLLLNPLLCYNAPETPAAGGTGAGRRRVRIVARSMVGAMCQLCPIDDRQSRPGGSAQGRACLRPSHRRGPADRLRPNPSRALENPHHRRTLLDGVVRHTNGVLSMAAMARDKGFQTLYVPASDAAEAALIPGLTVYPIESLFAFVAHLQGMQPIAPYNAHHDFSPETAPTYATDFSEVRARNTSSAPSRWRPPASIISS